MPLRSAKIWAGISRGIAVLLMMMIPPAAAKSPVALELVLALDTSASIDAHEFQLQIQGLADAFADPAVLTQLEALRPSGAVVAVVEWGAPGETRIVLPFTRIASSRDAKAFSFRIGMIRRLTQAGSTSIASGMVDSALLLEANQYDGVRKIIDISGDGRDNGGADLKSARLRSNAAGITVNGLPIMSDDATLDAYYRDKVIVGAASFIEPARDFHDFIRAIKQKLLRELRPLES